MIFTYLYLRALKEYVMSIQHEKLIKRYKNNPILTKDDAGVAVIDELVELYLTDSRKPIWKIDEKI